MVELKRDGYIELGALLVSTAQYDTNYSGRGGKNKSTLGGYIKDLIEEKSGNKEKKKVI
jgi:hypothetical protein